jgi:hypothetical protein
MSRPVLPRFYYELIRILSFDSVCAMAITTRIPTWPASSDFLWWDHGIVGFAELRANGVVLREGFLYPGESCGMAYHKMVSLMVQKNLRNLPAPAPIAQNRIDCKGIVWGECPFKCYHFSRIHIHTPHLTRHQGIYRSPELLLDISKPKSKVAPRLHPDVINARLQTVEMACRWSWFGRAIFRSKAVFFFEACHELLPDPHRPTMKPLNGVPFQLASFHSLHQGWAPISSGYSVSSSRGVWTLISTPSRWLVILGGALCPVLSYASVWVVLFTKSSGLAKAPWQRSATRAHCSADQAGKLHTQLQGQERRALDTNYNLV